MLRLTVGAASQRYPGELECGDQYLVAELGDQLLLAVVDGEGHGPQAARSARRALEALSPGQPLPELVRLCHQQLRQGRGAALALVSISLARSSLSWLAVGNIEGLVEGRSRRWLVQRAGMVGARLPELLPSSLALEAGDLLVLATDGVDERFTEDLSLKGSPQQIAERILAQHGKGSDDALVLVGRLEAA